MNFHHTSITPRRMRALRRMGAVALAGVLACGAVAWPPAMAAGAPSDDISSELETARTKLVDLTTQLEMAQALVDETELELDETRASIDGLEQQIDANEQELAAAQDELSAYIVSSYKDGGTDALALVFSATSFDELTSRLFYVNKLAAAESDRIEQVQGLQNDLAAQREELTQQESQLEELLDQQVESAQALESSQQEARDYVDGLSSELQDALAEERAAAAAAAREDAGQDDGSGSDDAGGAPQQGGGNDGGGSDTGGSTPQAPSGGSDSGSQGGSGNMTSSQRSAVVSAARSQIGVAYDYGAQNPGVAFDCSGLSQYAYRCAGISIGRTATAQYNQVKAAGNLTTNEGSLQAGDLVFYQTNGRIRHVGIYVGGGKVCHASDYSTGVIVTNLHYSSGFCGGGSPI